MNPWIHPSQCGWILILIALPSKQEGTAARLAHDPAAADDRNTAKKVYNAGLPFP
jgi:hypothetical protein